MIKTFRGKLVDQGIEIISLHTNSGSTGYRITKFEVMAVDPFNTNSESICKLYTTAQTAASATIDFSDQTLAGVAVLNNSDSYNYNPGTSIIFDNITFNQDLYVTNDNGDGTGTQSINYHIELEQVKLDLNENTVATLKNIRNINPGPKTAPP